LQDYTDEALPSQLFVNAANNR